MAPADSNIIALSGRDANTMGLAMSIVRLIDSSNGPLTAKARSSINRFQAKTRQTTPNDATTTNTQKFQADASKLKR
jgi:hypothetical protein